MAVCLWRFVMSNKEIVSLTQRVLISAQVMWVLTAFVVAIEMSGGLGVLIAIIALCVPVWGFYGMRWTLRLDRFSWWTMLLFSILWGGTLIPIVNDSYQFDDDYRPFYMIGSPLSFFLFVFLSNRQYATASVKSVIIEKILSFFNFMEYHSYKFKFLACIVASIIIYAAIVSDAESFIEKNRPDSYKAKFSEEELSTINGLSKTISSHEKQDCYDYNGWGSGLSRRLLSISSAKYTGTLDLYKIYCERVIEANNVWNAMSLWERWMVSLSSQRRNRQLPPQTFRNGAPFDTAEGNSGKSKQKIDFNKINFDGMHPALKEYLGVQGNISPNNIWSSKGSTLNTVPSLDACRMSLAFIIQNINPKYSNRLASGLSGIIGSKYEKGDKIVTRIVPKWSSAGLQGCKRFGARKSKISLLQAAMGNNLPNKPLTFLSDCTLGLLVMNQHKALKFRHKHGHDMSEEEALAIGYKIGKEIGTVVAELTYLYKDLENSNIMELSGELLEKATKKSSQYTKTLSLVNGSHLIKPLISKCDIFGINTNEF